MEPRTTIQGGESRLAQESPGLAARLAGWGVKPSDYIPGFRVSFRELDNICQMMQNQGWSGFIGLDEAVRSVIEKEIE